MQIDSATDPMVDVKPDSGALSQEGAFVSGPSDQELVLRAQSGDVEAVGELYDRHNGDIYRYVLARSGDPQLAEDLTGEVFMRMLTRLHRFRLRQNTPFRAWLYEISRNLLIDYYRKEKVISELHQAEDAPADIGDVAGSVERALTLEKIHHMLAQLDQAQAEVLTLRFIAGLSLKEVAHTLDKSTAAVKALQHRGLSALRGALEYGQE